MALRLRKSKKTASDTSIFHANKKRKSSAKRNPLRNPSQGVSSQPAAYQSSYGVSSSNDKPPNKQPWYMRKWVWAVSGIVLVSGAIGILGSGGGTSPAPTGMPAPVGTPAPTIFIASPSPLITSGINLSSPNATATNRPANVTPTETPAPPQQIATLNGTDINMRSGPGTDYDVVKQVSAPATAVILGVHGDWYSVEVDGVTGYLRNDFVTLQQESETTPNTATQTLYVSGIDVNMRSGPGTDYAVVRQVSMPLTVVILEKSGDWYHVNAEGVEGYLREDFLTDKQPTTTTPTAEATPVAKPTAQPTAQPTVQPTAQPSDGTSHTYYWTPNGKSHHSTSGCRSLARSKNILSGSLADALAAGKHDPCNNCIR